MAPWVRRKRRYPARRRGKKGWSLGRNETALDARCHGQTSAGRNSFSNDESDISENFKDCCLRRSSTTDSLDINLQIPTNLLAALFQCFNANPGQTERRKTTHVQPALFVSRVFRGPETTLRHKPRRLLHSLLLARGIGLYSLCSLIKIHAGPACIGSRRIGPWI